MGHLSTQPSSAYPGSASNYLLRLSGMRRHHHCGTYSWIHRFWPSKSRQDKRLVYHFGHCTGSRQGAFAKKISWTRRQAFRRSKRYSPDDFLCRQLCSLDASKHKRWAAEQRPCESECRVHREYAGAKASVEEGIVLARASDSCELTEEHLKARPLREERTTHKRDHVKRLEWRAYIACLANS